MSLKRTKLMAWLSAGAMVISSMSGIMISSGASMAALGGFDNRTSRYDQENFEKLVIIDPNFVEVEAGDAGIVGLPGYDGEQYFYGRTTNQWDASQGNDNTMGYGANSGYGYWTGNNQLCVWGVDYQSGGPTMYPIRMNDNAAYGGIQNKDPNNALSQKDYFQSEEHRNGNFTHTFAVFRYNTTINAYDVYNNNVLIRSNVGAYADYDTNGDGRLDEWDGTLMRASLMAGELMDMAWGNLYTQEAMGLNPSKDEPNTTGFLYAGVMKKGGATGEYSLHPLDSYVQGQIETRDGKEVIEPSGQIVYAEQNINAYSQNEAAINMANFGVAGDKIEWTSSNTDVVELMYGDSRENSGEWIKYHVKKPGESTITMKWSYMLPDITEAGKNVQKTGTYSIVIRVIGVPQGVEIQNAGSGLGQLGITEGAANSFETDQGGFVNKGEYKFILDQNRWDYVAQATVFDGSGVNSRGEEIPNAIAPFTYSNTKKAVPDEYSGAYWTTIARQQPATSGNGTLTIPNAFSVPYGGNVDLRRYGFDESYRIARKYENDKVVNTNLLDPVATGIVTTPYTIPTTWVIARTPYDSFRVAYVVPSKSKVKDRNFDYGQGTNTKRNNTNGYEQTNRFRGVADAERKGVMDMRFKTSRTSNDSAWDNTLGRPELLDYNPARHEKLNIVAANASGDRVDGAIARKGSDLIWNRDGSTVSIADIAEARAQMYSAGNGEFKVVAANEQAIAALGDKLNNNNNQNNNNQNNTNTDAFTDLTIRVNKGGEAEVTYTGLPEGTIVIPVNQKPAPGLTIWNLRDTGTRNIIRDRLTVQADKTVEAGTYTANVNLVKTGTQFDWKNWETFDGTIAATKKLTIIVVDPDEGKNIINLDVGQDFVADQGDKNDGSYKYLGDNKVALARWNGRVDEMNTKAVIDTVTYGGKTYTIVEVGKQAFAGKDKLVTVSLSANVTKIGNGAFKNCKNLRHVYIYGAVDVTERKNLFYQCNKVTVHATKNFKYTTTCFHNNKVVVKSHL